MRPRTIAVLGAGPAGLAAALALAREGHAVTVVEGDPFERTEPQGSFRWERKGIAHFYHPHAFIPRARRELKTHFPDVFDALIEAGARDVDVRPKIPGGVVRADDADLQYLGARRPLIEWGLRRAVLASPGITVRSSSRVEGLRLERGRVAGVDVTGGTVDASVVVDAMGRRSPMRGWVEAHGRTMPPQERSDVGAIHYSRYYRVRPGRTLPDGPWILSPRGDLGYMGFSSFPGDNGTFACVLTIPAGVPELKVLREERAFEAGVASIPLLELWANPETAEPITPVLAMGGLQNTITVRGDDPPAGLFFAGDSLAHTDPVLAHGIAFALIHATELARVLARYDDLGDAGAAYEHAVMPELEERFALATALDEQRLRQWTGGTADFTRREGAYELFSVNAAGAAALRDSEVFRVFVRRMGLLDSTSVLDDDRALQERIEGTVRTILGSPRPAAGPSREEMLALTAAAVAGGEGGTLPPR